MLLSYGVEKIDDFDSIVNRFSVTSSRNPLLYFSEQKDISEINEITIESPVNANARRITNVDSLQNSHFTKTLIPTVAWLSGIPYTGDSIWVWNGEHGPFQHLDFFELSNNGDTLLRGDLVLNPTGPRLKKGFTGSWGLGDWDIDPEKRMHGCHTGGIMAANGWCSLNSKILTGSDTLEWRGVAPKAMVLDDFSSRSNQRGPGDVNNHSFTGGDAYYTDNLLMQIWHYLFTIQHYL